MEKIQELIKSREKNDNIPVLDGYVDMGTFFYGYLYNDPKRKNGTIIKTSRTYSVDINDGVLITQNTMYNLCRESISS